MASASCIDDQRHARSVRREKMHSLLASTGIVSGGSDGKLETKSF